MENNVMEAPVKKKLTYNSHKDSSPDSSPIRFTRCGTQNMVISLDSEPDDSDDCVIVSETFEESRTTASQGNTNSIIEISSVKSLADFTTENEKTPVNGERTSTSESVETPSKQKGIKRKMDDSDEGLKPIRKKKTLKKKKKKMKFNEEESNNNSDYEENGESYDNSRGDINDSDSEEDVNPSLTKAMRDRVVNLLNTATEKEFFEIPHMTDKKYHIVISNRPFASWTDTFQKFGNVKGLRRSMLNNVCDVIIAKNIVRDVLGKCEKLSSKTEKRVAAVGTHVSKSPAILNQDMKLSSYQVLGLNWLVLMRSESLNSILADEMGLGKTIQVIAFLAYMKENGFAHEGYPHLIVVPASTLTNWANELQKWCPALKVSIYHGSQDERRYLRHVWFKDGFGDADVILTTYSCATNSREEKKMFRVKEFNYVIFDEAHMLKNMNTQRYEALIQFNGNFKILLTGTPLQNNLLELMSLLNFLMPDLFKGKVNHMKLLFSKCSKNVSDRSTDYERERVDQAKKIIEPFMLRRLKENVLRDLPSKTTFVEKCPLTEEQRIKYQEIAEEFKEAVAMNDSNCHLVYFMRLRKMANHPLLLRYRFTEDMIEKMADRLAFDPTYKNTKAEYIREDLYFKSDFELHCMCQDIESLQSLNYYIADEFFLQSGKLMKLANMLKSFKENGHRVLIFSQFIQMLDILQEFCRIKNYTYLRLDGSTQTSERQELIDLYNSDQNIFLFFLSTKAGGLGINLTSADTVVIHDIDFNPYNDKQAEDRCHRIGQTKPVQVFRLVSEETVEESIQNTAVKKLCLEKEVTAGNDNDDDNNLKTITQLLTESLGLESI